ncbi:MAG: hypothetical protein WKF63_04355 [Thermomicrobiales bacterium]
MTRLSVNRVRLAIRLHVLITMVDSIQVASSQRQRDRQHVIKVEGAMRVPGLGEGGLAANMVSGCAT